MGVRDLFTFLHRRGIPFEKHRGSYFANKTIAVDGYSLFFRLYYAAKKVGIDAHREMAISLLDSFIHKWPSSTVLIFVLDNPIKSDMKKDTIIKRREAEQALQREIQSLEEEENPVLRARRKALQMRSKETFPQVCRDMIDYLHALDYRVLISDGEAERTACEMVIANEAQYVFSNDSDCLALSCPAVIFEESGGYFHVFRLSDILDPLHLSVAEFTDFCILLGTDFNDRIMRPEEAFDNITRFRRIERIPGISEATAREVERVRRQYHADEYDAEEPVPRPPSAAETAPPPQIVKRRRKNIMRQGIAV